MSPTLLTNLSALGPGVHVPTVKTWPATLEEMAVRCSVVPQNHVYTTNTEATLKLGREKEGFPGPEFQISAKAQSLVGSRGAYVGSLRPWGSMDIWGYM